MPEKSEKTSLLDDRGKRGVTFSVKLEDIVKKIGGN